MAFYAAGAGASWQPSVSAYLIEASIGPVQEFIAAARRSRDLWFGSWLLSELSKAAALSLAETCGEESLVFPALPTTSLAPGSALNVANKIVARVERDPNDIAVAVEKAVKKRLADLRDDAFRRVRAAIDADVATKQVDDLLEFFWVAVPLPPNGDYASARQQLESLMAARKTTRDFVQVKGSNVPKSSLDGLRESVIAEDRYPGRRDALEDRRAKVAALYGKFRAGPAERLSGVDLLKRLGNPAAESRFPSTSHVAALPLLRRLERLTDNRHADAAHAWQQYMKALDKFGVERSGVPDWWPRHKLTGGEDGELLFEDRLSEYLVGEAFHTARKALGHFLRTADAPAPLPYYALLHADGDAMGAVIEAQSTPDRHRALSRALVDFAEDAPRVVREHEGALVYAGGDDVLAFLPLHTALVCARRLADAFTKRLADFSRRDGCRPTLSVGLAVSHHLEPLAEALALAREAEQHAKHVPGRNALAVTVAKRSGAVRTVAGSWRGNGMPAIDERLSTFVNLYRRDAVPAGAAYELADLARRLNVSAYRSEHAVLQRAMREEAMRILRRKRADRGKRMLDDTTLEFLAKLIDGMGEAAHVLHQLADELIVAHTFAEAARIASEEEENANVDP